MFNAQAWSLIRLHCSVIVNLLMTIVEKLNWAISSPSPHSRPSIWMSHLPVFNQPNPFQLQLGASVVHQLSYSIVRRDQTMFESVHTLSQTQQLPPPHRPPLQHKLMPLLHTEVAQSVSELVVIQHQLWLHVMPISQLRSATRAMFAWLKFADETVKSLTCELAAKVSVPFRELSWLWLLTGN